MRRFLPLFILFAISIILFSTCKKKNDDPQNESEFIDENNFTKLKEDAIIIDPSENIESISDDQIVINTDTDKIQNLSVGRIIVSGRSEMAPDGFAYEIKSISVSGNQVTIGTKQASFNEVYEEIAIDTEVKIDYDNFIPIDQKGGSSKDGESTRPIKVDYNSETNLFEIELVLYDDDKDYDTKLDQIIYEGSLQVMENNSSFIFNIRPFTDKVFHLSNEMEIEVINAVSVKSTLEFEREEITIARIPLTMTLPTSFVVNAYLKLVLGIEGDISATITVENTSNFNSIAVISYDETNGWTNIGSSEFTNDTDFEGSIELRIKPYIATGIAIEFVQYENASAGVYVEAYALFQAVADQNLVLNWDFGYGLELRGEAIVQVLNTFIDIDYEYIFWEYPYTILYNGVYYFSEIINLSPLNGATIYQVPVILSWEKDNFIQEVDFKVYLGESENSLEEIGTTDDLSYELDQNLDNGIHYWQIVAINQNNDIISESEINMFILNFNADLPIVTTDQLTDITQNTAIGGGIVVDEGTSTVTARGVCWDTYPNPNINDDHTVDGSGSGSFTSSLTGLTHSTNYYVRAYATNSSGTVYGNELLLTTLSSGNIPVVSTAGVTDITQTTATCGGNVSDDGGYTVTARGVCWSTSSNPTIGDEHTIDGSGMGTFTSNLSGLYPETNYYVRAYATNSEETAYGDNQSFETSSSGGGNGVPCPGTPTVTDIDGNVYNTVQIGEQCWMAENLKTTNYNNGTPIPNELGDWGDLTTGAYAWYDNDISWKEHYGALYNWFAAVDANGLCPTGWHVPSHYEDIALADYIGGPEYPDKLRSCRQVNSPLGDGCTTTEHPRWSEALLYGSDDYGFSALPGGIRVPSGFIFMGSFYYHWSSTEHVSYYAYLFGLSPSYTEVLLGDNNKKVGHSIRCIKD